METILTKIKTGQRVQTIFGPGTVVHTNGTLPYPIGVRPDNFPETLGANKDKTPDNWYEGYRETEVSIIN